MTSLINVKLMDRTTDGRIRYDGRNWVGVIYKIPLNCINLCTSIPDFQFSGVYFLVADEDFPDRRTVYIGQADVRQNGGGLLMRIQEPHPSIANWSTAFVLTMKNNSLGATEINYLERSFYDLVRAAGRYRLANRYCPSVGNIVDDLQDEMDDFIRSARVILDTTGYKFFTPLPEVPVASEPETTEPVVLPEPEIIEPVVIPEPESIEPVVASEPEPHEEVLFYLKNRKCDAIGKFAPDGNGFILLRGSKIRFSVTANTPPHSRRAREEYADIIDGDSIITEDIFFPSVNKAACFVTAVSTNAQIAWCTSSGMTLKDYKSQHNT